MESSAYKKNCVAYCEQFLYWFFGPEIPYPNSNCAPGVQCTFTTSKSFAVTNGYAFTGGLTAAPEIDVLKLAFNLGSTYTYSTTSTTTQTVTLIRPANQTVACGYWTFLPYFVT